MATLSLDDKQAPDVPISPQEAMLLFSKSNKTVWYAIYRDKVLARQSVNSQNWMISLNSCIALWGQPVAENLVADIRQEWEDGRKNLSSQG